MKHDVLKKWLMSRGWQSTPDLTARNPVRAARSEVTMFPSPTAGARLRRLPLVPPHDSAFRGFSPAPAESLARVYDKLDALRSQMQTWIDENSPDSSV
jgi:hypothetical protein